MNDMKYFYKGIWILGDIFHTPDFETALTKVENVYTDLKVGLASLAFAVLIVMLSIAIWFIACDMAMYGIIAFALVVPVCIWLRRVLYNYVDLRIKVDGQVYKIISCGIRQRQKLYEIEDYLKHLSYGYNS